MAISRVASDPSAALVQEKSYRYTLPTRPAARPAPVAPKHPVARPSLGRDTIHTVVAFGIVVVILILLSRWR